MKNSNSGGKEAAAENSDEVSVIDDVTHCYMMSQHRPHHENQHRISSERS